jgi:hypothetical protein
MILSVRSPYPHVRRVRAQPGGPVCRGLAATWRLKAFIYHIFVEHEFITDEERARGVKSEE